MSKIIRCGVVGCGAIGPNHAKGISVNPKAKLVAVCDIIKERADKIASQYEGVAVYTDYETMLNEAQLDLVHVCLPSGMHADFGCMAAKKGINVITEKPIDVTLEAADRLIRTCRECGVKLSTISQHRFDPDLAELKRWVDEGRLGKLTTGCSHTKWHRSQEYYDSGDWRGTWALDGGGALMNQSVHYVDMLQYMLGEVEEVYAYCETLTHERIEVEDVAVASVKFKSGAVGMIEGNTTAYPGFCTRLDVYGSKGGVIIENDRFREWKIGEEKWRAEDDKDKAQAAGSAVLYGNSHARQIADVVDAILENREPLITGQAARHPLAIILAIYESARTHQPVQVK